MDDRLQRALGEHLRRFRAQVESGGARLGFKVAFNVEAVQRRLGLEHAIAAGLTERTRLQSPGPHSLASTTRAAVEAEVAVVLRDPITPDATRAEVLAAIESWAPAIEVVDLDHSFDDPVAIIEAGVFHRAVVLGEPVAPNPAADLRGIRARITLGGGPALDLDAGEATGDVPELLLTLARCLAVHDEGLRAGDAIILGSMNPLTFVEPPVRFVVELDGMGSVALDLVP